MFAWIAQAAIERFGDEGMATVLEGVRRYGCQRGQRMAHFAADAGQDLSIAAFKVFGEINFGETENVSRVDRYEPVVEQTSTRCSWCDTWRRYNLLAYGRLYCEEIDAAIAEGFNPALGFQASSTLSHGDADCRFTYHGASLSREQQERLASEREAVGTRCFRPWEFHIAELYYTLRDVLVERLGSSGREAAQSALANLSAKYGAKAAEGIRLREGEVRAGGTQGVRG
jgi:hypothetical protein